MADRVRIQVDVRQRDVDTLDRLVRLTGAVTRAEAIRRALTVYNVLAVEGFNGKKVMIEDDDGNRQRLLIP